MSRNDKNRKNWLWALAAVLPLAACASSSVEPGANILEDTTSFHAPVEQVLDAGSSVRIVVFGSDALSGSYHIGRDGTLRLGALGSIQAAGLTAQELEQKIASLLKDRGQQDARVSVMLD